MAAQAVGCIAATNAELRNGPARTPPLPRLPRHRPLQFAEVAAAMPAATIAMVKGAINATGNAPHHASGSTDADQSMLSCVLNEAFAAREKLQRNS